MMGRGRGLFRQGQDPGFMFDLVTGVPLFIIGHVGLPHFSEDFQPTLAQTAQGAGMALAFLTFLHVIHLRPAAGFPAKVRPQMHRGRSAYQSLPLLAKPPFDILPCPGAL